MLSCVRFFVTQWTAACQAPLSFMMSCSLLKFMSIESVMLSHPFPPPSPFAFNLSQRQDLFHELALSIRWPKYWSFSISPSSEYSGLISFRMDWFDLLADWFDLLAIQRNLKCLLQYHSSEAYILLLSEELWSNSYICT